MAAAKKLFAGDTRPTRLVYEIDKEAIDITDYQFQLLIGYKTGTLVKNGVIVDAAAGKFEFQWAAAQGETPTLRRVSLNIGITTKQLFELFPKKPGKKMAYLAGVPKPKGCI